MIISTMFDTRINRNTLRLFWTIFTIPVIPFSRYFYIVVSFNFIILNSIIALTINEGSLHFIYFALIAIALLTGPGLFFLSILNLNNSNPYLSVVIALATSLATTMLSTWLLYILGIYSFYTTIALVIFFGTLSIVGIIKLLKKKQNKKYYFDNITQAMIENIAIVAILAFCFGLFNSIAGYPITAWDGIVSWDKWASDITYRTHIGGYVSGGYPLGIPLIISTFYKILAPLNEYCLFSLSNLLMAGFLQVFVLLLLISILAFSKEVNISPIWPIAILLGNNAFLYAIIKQIGYVDIPLASFVAVACALIAAHKRLQNDNSSRIVAFLFYLIAFSISFTKGNGFQIIILSTIIFAASNYKKFKPYILASALAIVTSGIYYLHQWTIGVWIPKLAETSPFNHSLPVVSSHKILIDHCWEHFFNTIEQWLGFYCIPNSLEIIITICTIVLIILALIQSKTRIYTIIAVIAFCSWYYFASYDPRNAIFILPLIACIIPYALHLSLQKWKHIRILATILLTIISIYPITQTRFVEIARKSLKNKIELSPFLKYDTYTRRAAFAKLDKKDFAFFTSSPAARRASHIIMANTYYRIFKKGIYPLQANGGNAKADHDLLIQPQKRPLYKHPNEFVPVSEISSKTLGQILYIRNPKMFISDYTLMDEGTLIVKLPNTEINGCGFISITTQNSLDNPMIISETESITTKNFFKPYCDKNTIRIFFWIPNDKTEIAFKIITKTELAITKVEVGY